MQVLRRSALVAAGAFGAIVVAGCGGSSGAGSQSAGPSGIRGTELPAFSCGASADGKALRVRPGAVLEIRVCPLAAPEPFNRPARSVSLMRGSRPFQIFLSALSLPDAPAQKQQLCPEYAELLPTVIARTATTAVLVHLPSDACGHSLPAVSTALSSVIDGSSATP